MQSTAAGLLPSRLRRLAIAGALLGSLAACGTDGGLYQPQDVPPGPPPYPLAEGSQLTVELGLAQPE
ncbi:MAG: hypothetical protein AAFU72_15030, partial [Pseudomonadota bacterium]